MELPKLLFYVQRQREHYGNHQELILHQLVLFLDFYQLLLRVAMAVAQLAPENVREDLFHQNKIDQTEGINYLGL